MNRVTEDASVRDKIKGLLRESGAFGEEAYKEELNKAFGDMSSTNHNNQGIGNFFRPEAWLTNLGLPSTANYGEVQKRFSEMLLSERNSASKAYEEFYEEKHKGSDRYLEARSKFYENDNYYNMLGEYLSKKNVGNLFSGSDAYNFEKNLGESYYSRSDINKKMNDLKNADGSINTEKVAELDRIFKDLGVDIDLINGGMLDWANTTMVINSEFQALGSTLKNALKDFTSGAILNVSKDFGKNMYDVWINSKDISKAYEGLGKSLADAGAQLLDNISAQMVNTGLALAQNGALTSNMGLIAGGLALAAAGGVGSFASGILSAYSSDTSDDDTDDSIERLEKLKDNLADLLKQARDDAKYYEETLRAKSAIAVTDSLSTTSVNDMIMTPQGNFSTAPDDYIMAMKDPTSLMGSGGANVNVQIVNQSGTALNVQSTKQTTDSNGNINLEMVVNGIVQQSMARGEYDETLMAMQANASGRSVYA